MNHIGLSKLKLISISFLHFTQSKSKLKSNFQDFRKSKLKSVFNKNKLLFFVQNSSEQVLIPSRKSVARYPPPNKISGAMMFN